MSRHSGACPIPIDWRFKTSSRFERRLMIEEAYRNYERQQREAAEWYRDEAQPGPGPEERAAPKKRTAAKG